MSKESSNLPTPATRAEHQAAKDRIRGQLATTPQNAADLAGYQALIDALPEAQPVEPPAGTES